MPRFVVLTHDYPLLHWDLMLEKEASLRTWRLLREPGCTGPIDAEGLCDHRLAYLDYEGPLSGNRGTVRRFDRGEYSIAEESEARLVLDLSGLVLRGRGVMEQTGEPGKWSFSLESRL